MKHNTQTNGDQKMTSNRITSPNANTPARIHYWLVARLAADGRWEWTTDLTGVPVAHDRQTAYQVAEDIRKYGGQARVSLHWI